jgi:hypothetical protein
VISNAVSEARPPIPLAFLRRPPGHFAERLGRARFADAVAALHALSEALDDLDAPRERDGVDV